MAKNNQAEGREEEDKRDRILRRAIEEGVVNAQGHKSQNAKSSLGSAEGKDIVKKGGYVLVQLLTDVLDSATAVMDEERSRHTGKGRVAT